MSLDDIRRIAEECARSKGIHIARFHSIEFVPGEDGENDEWVVRFETPIPLDVISGPELVLIAVNCKTMNASLVETL